MKTIVGILMAFVMLSGITAAYAEPERLAIKDPAKKTKERAAASQLKNINLQDIEDPAARRAIQEILNYLGLQSKK